MSKKNKPVVVTKPNGDNVVVTGDVTPINPNEGDGPLVVNAPPEDETDAANRAAAASLATTDIQESPATPDEVAASQALRALSAVPIEPETPQDLQGILTPMVRPTEEQEALAVAATALEAYGDLASARAIRTKAPLTQAIIEAAIAALSTYNASKVEAFKAAVSA